MKKIFFLLVVVSLFLVSCAGNSQELNEDVISEGDSVSETNDEGDQPIESNYEVKEKAISDELEQTIAKFREEIEATFKKGGNPGSNEIFRPPNDLPSSSFGLVSSTGWL